MKPIHYARKKRQLHYLARRLNDLLLHRKEVSRSQINKLVSKIQKLVAELMHVISRADMKRTLGAVAIYIGVAFPYQASAQDFAAPQLNPFGLISTYDLAAPAFADMDNDGDLDLLVGEYYGNMQYFENTSTSPVEKIPAKFNLQIFPNPVSDILTVQSVEEIIRIEIYNTLGQAIGTFENNNNRIHLDKLNPGMYVAKFITPEGEFTTRKIQKH